MNDLTIRLNATVLVVGFVCMLIAATTVGANMAVMHESAAGVQEESSSIVEEIQTGEYETSVGPLLIATTKLAEWIGVGFVKSGFSEWKMFVPVTKGILNTVLLCVGGWAILRLKNTLSEIYRRLTAT